MARTLRFLQDDPVLQCPKGSLASVGDPMAGQLIAQGIAEEVVEVTVAAPVPPAAVVTDTAGHPTKKEK
jgi:hypothetical protein